MTRWERYEPCDRCGAHAGQPCLNNRAVHELSTMDGRIVAGRKLAKPHPGRATGPRRLVGVAAASRTTGGRRVVPAGARWMSDGD